MRAILADHAYWLIPFFLLVLVILAASRVVGGRMREDGQAEVAGPGQDGTFFPDFRSMIDQVAAPLAARNPGQERLDGAMGVPGRPIAWFERGGTYYAVNGESRVDALVAIRDWMDRHPGEDPFETQPGKQAAGRLVPRKEPGLPDRKAVRIETG